MSPALHQIFKMLGTQTTNVLALLRGPYSQAELADILETEPARVNDWEQGRSSPQPRFARALMIHAKGWTGTFGLRLTDLLDADPEKPQGE